MKAIWFVPLALAGLLTACLDTRTLSGPANPTGFTATAVYATSVTLSWNPLSGVTGYMLERKTDATAYERITQLAGTTYTDTGLTASTTYTYRLKTVISASSMSTGVEQTATTTAGTLVKIGRVTLRQQKLFTPEGQPTGLLFGNGLFYSLDSSELRPDVPATSDTCEVRRADDPEVTPPAPKTLTSIDAGSSLPLKANGAEFAFLFSNSRFVGMYYFVIAYFTLPNATITLDTPGAASGYPALTGLTFPAVPAPLTVTSPSADSDGIRRITRDTTFTWPGSGKAESYLDFYIYGKDSIGQPVNIVCSALDDGVFEFSPDIKRILAEKDFATGYLSSASRHSTRKEVRGDAQMLLRIERVESYSSPSP